MIAKRVISALHHVALGLAIALIGLFVLAQNCGAQETDAAKVPGITPPLTENKLNRPGNLYRPWNFYGWMGEAVTDEGLRRDMEAIKQAGFAGNVCFHAMGTAWFPGSKLVDPPAAFLSQAWRDRLVFMAAESKRLGLGFGIANSSHWDTDGGPWIKPKDAMKILTYSSTQVQGGEASLGAATNVPYEIGDYYEDIAAYAVPLEDAVLASPKAVRSTPGFIENRKINVNGQLMTPKLLKKDAQKDRLTIQLAEPKTIRGMELLFGRGNGRSKIQITAKNTKTGKSLVSEVVRFGLKRSYGLVVVNLPDIEADHFLIEVSEPSGRSRLREVIMDGQSRVNFLQFKAGYMYDWGHGNGLAMDTEQTRRHFGLTAERNSTLTFRDAQGKVYQPGNLKTVATEPRFVKLDAQGQLAEKLPEGKWRVVRIGGTLNGKLSHIDDGYLTCDKFDPQALQLVFNHLFKSLYDDLAEEGLGGILSVCWTDSWEQRSQNWSHVLPGQMKAKRGYELRPFLPVLCGGLILDDSDYTERFLADFRRTIADLIAENYFGEYRRLCEALGVTYAGDNTGAQQFMYDSINYARRANFPVGEFWLPRGGFIDFREDIKTAASTAHLYLPAGRQSVWAEAFTGPMRLDLTPAMMRSIINQSYCRGVTQINFFTPHNPKDLHPGVRWGQWWSNIFSPQNTWWKYMNQMTQYMSRCQQLLESGNHVADFAVYVGNEVPNFIAWRDTLPFPIPFGYSYDGCGTDAILHLFSVQDGWIVCPNGTRYRALVLPNTPRMSLPVLKKIESLVREGATVIGPKPEGSIGLEDYPAGNQAVRDLGRKIWGETDGKTETRHQYHAGQVFWGASFDEVAEALSLVPAFICRFEEPHPKAVGKFSDIADPIEWIHRRNQETEIFWISNNLDQAVTINAGFRVTGKQPQLYDPEDGTLVDAPIWKQKGGHTFVSIPLKRAGGVFVLFQNATEKKPHLIALESVDGSVRLNPVEPNRLKAQPFLALRATEPSLTLPPGKEYQLDYLNGSTTQFVAKSDKLVTEIQGPWSVQLDLAWGGPGKIELPELKSLHQHPDSGVRYYSGSAYYETTFPLDTLPAQGESVWLELGKFRDFARVWLNGKELGYSYVPSRLIEVSDQLAKGNNQLKVEVINGWRNRMIGDEQLPPDVDYHRLGAMNSLPDWLLGKEPRSSGRYTFSSWKSPWSKDEELLPSGLSGPVKLYKSLVLP